MEHHIIQALEEDMLEVGDVTSMAIFSGEHDSFTLIAKEPGILCGVAVAVEVLLEVDERIECTFFRRDGERLESGMTVAEISGPVAAILSAERTMLNYLSHLSGIATKTAKYVEAAAPATILDTRKTIPGLRHLQKYAVTCGGGRNHRMGLHDMVMIKDNHIDAAGGITAAVQRTRERWGERFAIEVETRTLAEVREALECGVQRIMLDNMPDELMSAAVALVDGAVETEASGNVTLERIPAIAATGVDFISVGALTHTVTALDFSLRKL